MKRTVSLAFAVLCSSAALAVECRFVTNNPRDNGVQFGIERKLAGTQWPDNPVSVVRGVGEVIEVVRRSGGSVRVTINQRDVTATADVFSEADLGRELVIGAARYVISAYFNPRSVFLGILDQVIVSTPSQFTVETYRVRMLDHGAGPGAWTYRVCAFVEINTPEGLVTNRSAYSNEVTVAVLRAPSDTTVVADFGDTGLSNISARGQTAPADNAMIVGIIVREVPRTYLIRGVGPALEGLVPGYVPDPQLRVFRGSELIAQNDDWSGSPAVIAATSTVGTWQLRDGSADAALVLDLEPGLYTAICEPARGPSGICLAEAYELPLIPR